MTRAPQGSWLRGTMIGTLSGIIVSIAATSANAQALATRPLYVDFRGHDDPITAANGSSWRVSLLSSLSRDVMDQQAPAAPVPLAVPFEYSDAYHTRARIHRIASFAMLPLFVAQGILGESLYNNSTPGKRTAHAAVATAIGGLFGLNSVTGVWNLREARHDPHGRTRRLWHGLLMLGADGGFLATAITAPTDGTHSRATHRALAFTSISVASAGYLIMIFGGK